MKHLFIVRHGDYLSSNKRISAKGRAQIERLVPKIKQIVIASSCYVISSALERALDSAEILIAGLGLKDFEIVPYLGGGIRYKIMDYNLKKDNDEMLKIIKEREAKADSFIMVAHLEALNTFSYYFLERELGFRDLKKMSEFDFGEAFYIDLENRVYRILP